MQIGEIIKNKRTERGYTQKQLSDLSGVSRVAIGNYERGDRFPNIAILEKLARGLGITTNELIKSASPFIDEKNNSTKVFVNLNDLSTTIDYAHDDYKKDVSLIDAYEALNILLCFVKNDIGLTGKELEVLLNKITDLIELEVFKIKKSRGIEIK